MTDVETPLRAGEPTDEEVAAAVAAAHLALRRCGPRGAGGSRWMRAGRAESVAALAEPAGWATVERPR